MKANRAEARSVAISSDVLMRISDPVAVAIWVAVLASGAGYAPDMIRARFNVSKQRYAKAMRHLRECGLVELAAKQGGDGRMTGTEVNVLWEPRA